MPITSMHSHLILAKKWIFPQAVGSFLLGNPKVLGGQSQYNRVLASPLNRPNLCPPKLNKGDIFYLCLTSACIPQLTPNSAEELLKTPKLPSKSIFSFLS